MVRVFFGSVTVSNLILVMYVPGFSKLSIKDQVRTISPVLNINTNEFTHECSRSLKCLSEGSR
jgi:hypothetical protein